MGAEHLSAPARPGGGRREGILALDAGTSGARCLVLRPGTGAVTVARQEWCYQTPSEIAPLGKSFDPDAFWSILCQLTRRALDDAGLSGRDIAAVGVTSQRQGLVVIDGEGRPLYAGPNQDARALAQGLAIDGRLGERVYDSTGKLPSVIMAPARLQWLRAHDEAGFQQASAVLTIGDWLAYRLTGEARAERSLSGACGLLDITTGRRDETLLADLEVPSRLLPPLVPPLHIVGEVTSGAADDSGLAPGTPVVIAGADTQCGLAGMGIDQPGEAGIVSGWSCPLQQVTAEARLDPARRTWTGLHVLPNRWVVESSAADAGRMWRWWCEMLLGSGDAALEDAATLAAQAAPAIDHVIALLGPGAMNAAAMGLHLGGVLMTTPVGMGMGAVGRAELLRAALENIAYALRANLEQAEAVAGRPAERIALGGGFTRVPVFAQILADALARPIEVAREADVTARGAALLAARAVGLPDTSLVTPTERVEPDPAAVKTYRRQYDRWRRLGEALDTIREEIS